MLLNHDVNIENINSVLSSFSYFQQFAFLSIFDESEWEGFIEAKDQEEAGREQVLISNSHTQNAGHSDHNDHDQVPADHNQAHSNDHVNDPGHDDHNDHDQYPVDHDDHGDVDFTHHTDSTAHADTWITEHVQGHGDAATGHTDWSDPSSDHWDVYQDTEGDYNNYVAHYHRYDQHDDIGPTTDHVNTHSNVNTPTHDDNGQHDDHSDTTDPHVDTHSDYSRATHSDYGFDHDNYVPTTPVIYNADGAMYGLATIGIYAYDANQHGLGSGEIVSQTVKYNLGIRKVKDLDGNYDYSSWHTLLTKASMGSNGGITHVLDTIDPLNVGNSNPHDTEGFYELRVIAENDPQAGVAYVSDTKIKEIKIQQNAPPEISVQNGEEFIDFVFGFEGAIDPADIYKIYEDMYVGENDREGIFVKINMRDPTIENWQKGRVLLKDSSGITVAAREIYWGTSDGVVGDAIKPLTTKSANSVIPGYAYIPSSAFGVLDEDDARIVVEVSDYFDSECTQPAGATTVQQTISISDPTLLRVGIDTEAPIVTDFEGHIASPSGEWRRFFNIGLDYDGGASGIKTAEYNITDSPNVPSSWKVYEGSPYDNTLGIDEATGVWYLHYRAVDNNNNERVGYVGPYKVDRTEAALAVNQEVIDGESFIRLHFALTDEHSGVRNFMFVTDPQGTWHIVNLTYHQVPTVTYENGNMIIDYETDYSLATGTFDALHRGEYEFMYSDLAGNGSNTIIEVINVPEVNNVRLVDVVSPPVGTDVSLVNPESWVEFPAIDPVKFKAGYQLTFEADVENADSIRVELFKDDFGTPVEMIEGGVVKTALHLDVPSRQQETVRFSFWVDKHTSIGEIMDLRVAVINTDESANSENIGLKFGRIVGSSLEDSESSQTK